MNFSNVIMKNKAARAWFFTGLALLLVAVIATIAMLTFLLGLFVSLWGDDQLAGAGEQTIYQSDYKDKADALAKSNALNVEIAEEGFTLLKNENDCLPLAKGSKVSVFGKNSVNMVYGGSGSGGVSGDTAKTIYESLEDAGFTCNPTLRRFYNDDKLSGSGRASNPSMGIGTNGYITGFATGETPQGSYTSSIKRSYTNYNDAAIVVISRIGGEGFDLPRSMYDGNGDAVEGAYSVDDHYLELDENEQDLLEAVSESFDKVVLIVNSSTTMELGFLEGNTYGDDTQIDYDFANGISAALWIGGPGATGIMALGEILCGDVNPSGHTVDTYAADFKANPTWQNFSTNLTDGGDKYLGDKTQFYFVEYEEGIYLGYRYYETRGATDGESWYDKNVVYPFGYGLSYTTFSWEVASTSLAAGAALTASSEVTIKVKVTNTGSCAGKDVVQLYCTPPYLSGEIEKSSVVLCGLAKTKLLEPNESETVSVTFTAYSLASYDYNDANHNSFKGYELDAGTYAMKISRNAHDVVATVNYTVAAGGIKFATDTTTNVTVENRFDGIDSELETSQMLSRANWTGTMPQSPTVEERTKDSAFFATLKSTDSGNTMTATTMPTTGKTGTVKLADLIGKPYTDEGWDDLLDQLTISDMTNLVNQGAFKTSAIVSIGKPATTDADGPVGFCVFMGTSTVYGTCVYCCEVIIASTWNLDLAYRMGESVGNEGILGNVDGDGAPYSGWYAPAVNLHRTPFSGRNTEYYSEDGFIAGKMAASVIKGAASKGVYTQVKHFAVNDQETHRDANGLCTWLTEQALRELYLKPFEYAVKEGGSKGMMSSFNRIGSVWAGGNYALLTEVLRGEWGFNGMVICDFLTQGYMNAGQMAYAGGDLNLTTTADKHWTNISTNKFSSTNATDVTVLRKNAKNILYAVANSNAMNGIDSDTTLHYTLALWKQLLLAADALIVVGVGVWGALVVTKSCKKVKEGQQG